MTELWTPLREFLLVLGVLLLQFLYTWAILITWIAWWLWGVNWKKAWPVLAQGAWVPVVLLTLISALAWSQIVPASCNCLRFVTIPNFWWQLGEVTLFVGLAFFCGWLQGYLGWEPQEIQFEPAHAGGHEHGHNGHHDHGQDAHGHDHGHHDHGHH